MPNYIIVSYLANYSDGYYHYDNLDSEFDTIETENRDSAINWAASFFFKNAFRSKKENDYELSFFGDERYEIEEEARNKADDLIKEEKAKRLKQEQLYAENYEKSKREERLKQFEKLKKEFEP